MAPRFKPIDEHSRRPKPGLSQAQIAQKISTNRNGDKAVRQKSSLLFHANQLENIEQLQAHLWDAADNLRANSKLTANEYCMPVLGVIFLRHATNRYDEALKAIEADQTAGKMPKRSLTSADFKKRRALMLPKKARYEELINL